jgi:branched-chain amino acid aminotransferase
MHNLRPTDSEYRCLPGIPSTTRINPIERTITIEELQYLHTQAEVMELFGTGTAAVVCPIGTVGYRGEVIDFPHLPGGYGTVSKALLETLQGMQLGTIESDWSVRCE